MSDPERPMVLVVDDSDANRLLLSAILRRDGFAVELTSSAAEARVWLGTNRPSVILMDIQMPDMDGLEFTRELRSRPASEALPIVAVTSLAMAGDAEAALEAGCDDYISKPIDTRALSTRLRRAVEKRAGLAG